MFTLKLKPVNQGNCNKKNDKPLLEGTESEFDTSVLNGNPVGRRDIGLSVPLPAQPEVFRHIVDEKIEQFKKGDVAIKIDVWRDAQTGRTHIMDGQHRFISGAELGKTLQLRWKKYGIPPTDVDWSRTRYIEGVPAKEKIKGNKSGMK